YNTTVTGIVGEKRIEGVFISDVDENRKPVLSTERFVDCDTLVLSVGLIPENEIAFQTGIELSEKTGGPIVDDMLQTDIDGVFACGNSLHVHDLVDFVSIESEVAGKNSAIYILNKTGKDKEPIVIETKDGKGVSGTVPQLIKLNQGEDEVALMFRPNSKFRNCTITARINDRIISSKKMPVAVPGEMCELKVSKKKIQPFKKNDTLTVEITQ
ncbi:MAG: FAD-dependent oxidoreductase, partial [Ruminococcaceae bacterium]|nr:FAD-dependent oxidoreductase [Oscillospiraceae bacterium]